MSFLIGGKGAKKRIFLNVFNPTVSLEKLQEENGMSFSDDGNLEHQVLGSYDYILNCLTNRQKQVAKLLFQGYSRDEIAEELGVCTQAIHQIVPRMRKRIKTVIGKDLYL